MKRTILLFAALLAFTCGLTAQNGNDVTVKHPVMERHGQLMTVDMTLDLSKLEVKSNRAFLLTPRLIGQQDTLDLPAVGIYGRRRYYYSLREDNGMISGEDETVLKNSKRPDTLAYHAVVSYDGWMNGARLTLSKEEYGCCHTVLAENTSDITDYKEMTPEPFRPEFVYVRPEEETVKSRSLSGSAFIDFPVNRTEIYPEYRGNAAELAKIRATIDSVRKDGDVTITSLAIKGYASPEGTYANNERLARGRTGALREYVNGLYHFGQDFIATDYEAENWEGLRRFVEASGLSGKEGILALIDSDREPDNKEWAIKSKYPADYRYLLEHCYPALRRSDYRIEYVVRHFSDAAQIRGLVKTRPQKLSLGEFYIAAQELEPGSEEFNRIFETAVHLFPDDETANLNAAVSTMQRGDMKGAERYLPKAGNSPEAVYARGVHAALTGDYIRAEELLRQVVDAIPQAATALEQVRKLMNNK